MDILFVITSFICAIIVPIINYQLLGLKGFVFSFILIVFALVVLAYAILSVYKLKISKISYLDSQKIVSWGKYTEPERSKKPFVISLIIGLAFGILIYFNGSGLFSAILLSLSCAFAVLGWWLMGIKRYQHRLGEVGVFLLSHMGVICNGKTEVFNGYSKGITGAKREENLLVLTILKKKKENDFRIEIPEEKIEEVDNFLNDLKKHFSGENDEIQ